MKNNIFNSLFLSIICCLSVALASCSKSTMSCGGAEPSVVYKLTAEYDVNSFQIFSWDDSIRVQNVILTADGDTIENPTIKFRSTSPYVFRQSDSEENCFFAIGEGTSTIVLEYEDMDGKVLCSAVLDQLQVEIDNLEFETSDQDSVIWITDYTGTAESGMLRLPASIDNKRVVGIGDGVNPIFDDAYINIDTLDISSCYGLTTISEFAFNGCKRIKNVNLSGLEELTIIDKYAFANDDDLESIDLSGLTKLEIIGESAFDECYELKAIDFSELTSLISINKEAFSHCNKIETIDLIGLTKLETIEEGAFGYMNSLSSITLADLDSLQSIAYSAFYGCALADSISISNLPKLSFIGKYAFAGNALVNGGGIVELPTDANTWSPTFYIDSANAKEEFTRTVD